jgi:hypothetical protein
MTMDQQQHPDDELLAAFADGEGSGAAAHVEGCDRCGALVRDLRMLRTSLAELPDIAPHRPLRLLPALEAPAAPRTGFAVLVRRLFAPAMVAGAALVLVGSVGMAATPGGLTATGAGGAASGEDSRGVVAEAAPSDGGSESYVTARASSLTDAGNGPAQPEVATATPTARESSGAAEPLRALGPTLTTPWLPITIIGAVLLIVTMILRWTVVPRAPGPPLYPGA